MFNEMGLPDMEFRCLVAGSEVAVAAIFIRADGLVDVVVGIVEPDEASRIAMCADVAAEAWRAADWKSVAGMDVETVPFDAGGEPTDSVNGGLAHDTWGDDFSETGFPF